jgi:predicted ATPase/class 3 adenylate cyclase
MSAAPAPVGVVTFLFTDVEGSTRRWEADAEAMRVALATHDEVLRQTIEAHGGFIFKHTGDGVCAAFASPRSAVDAAVAAQRALELPVRMGMATGEAEPRDGDYFGVVLNRASRVMAAGHGGQILLADSTAALLSGVEPVDLGSRRLPDLQAPVRVFQVRAPGLRTEFPPLRAFDASPGNLRPQTTSFIGRESEAAELRGLVKTHQLVTLTGVGGVGKTRLATEVAAQLTGEFLDGVWFFDLAAVTDPAAVPDAVAKVLGITQQPGQSVTASVATALEGRLRLLILDNCEHVVEAAADLVEAILDSSATVTIVATSREGLGLASEQQWPVAALDCGEGLDSAAASLFVDRAHNVAPHFSLTQDDEACAVVEICRRLDGIPLAIELAASRMASMTATGIRDLLDQRFRLLVGSRRGLHRHHTLRHAVAWSYDLLDDAEKSLLIRCSVFASGFDLDSACAVAGFDDRDEYAVLDLLHALVRKSLLVADRTSDRIRLSMLETIRQFAEEQLVAGGEATATRTAHARYFAGREADLIALWDSPRQRKAYDWFSAEFPNLRTAFRWATDNGDLDTAATIATSVGPLGLWVENYEPVAWAEELLEAARAAAHPRLAFLYVIASQCYYTGRTQAAVRYADAAQVVLGRDYEDLPDGPYRTDVGFGAALGIAYHAIGRRERTIECYRAQLARGHDTQPFTWAALVYTLALTGRFDGAMAAAAGLVETAETSRNPCALSFALLAYGCAAAGSDSGRAREALQRGLGIARESGNRYNEIRLVSALARFEAHCGDPLAALDYSAVAIHDFHDFHDAGNTANMRLVLVGLAACLDRLGWHDPAATITGFVVGPRTPSAAASPGISPTIAHLREIFGDDGYESLARKGYTMSTSAMATYAYDQIDQARAALITGSK